MRSRDVALGLAVVGFLSYTACTAEKTSMKNPEVASVATHKPEPAKAEAIAEIPKVADGVFAADDHLQVVYFDLNQSKLSPAAKTVVAANAEWLKPQPPYLIRIVGYADRRGSLKKNERLAERRAQGIRDAYVELGLSKDRFSIVGRGAEEPACQPLTEECLSQSRRGETLIENQSLASR